jgi:hypothetical protein
MTLYSQSLPRSDEYITTISFESSAGRNEGDTRSRTYRH